ncbi:MAG: hypothetical protein K2K28_03960, partial [Clostridia bacterium]|nr:hypothetical protein [Clostridia bacterium]
FAKKNLIGELIDDTTRAFIKAVKSFNIDTVKSWNDLEVNEANKAMVSEFSESVKAAHALYNTILEEAQLAFITDGDTNYLEKLYAVEEELKPVKTRFGITAKVTSLSLSPDSTHKTQYNEGEKFDMTGLVLIVNYDDFTTSIADLSKITLASGSDGELTALDRYVTLQGYGVTVRLSITVTEGGENGGNGGGTKSNTGLIVGCVVGGVCFAAAVAVAVVLVLLWRKKKSQSAESEATLTDAEDAKPEQETQVKDGGDSDGKED